MLCPDCGGTKKAHGFMCGTKGCKVGSWDCFRCNGTGKVPDAMAEWIKKGKLLKEKRMNPVYMSQRDKAKQLNVKPSDYSRAEAGYFNPDDILAPCANESQPMKGGGGMSLECKCDECNKYIDADNDVYCFACYDSLRDEIKLLQERIEELEKELQAVKP